MQRGICDFVTRKRTEENKVSASEWALSAAARFAEQERIKSEQWARALQRHQIITAQASRFWGDIRQALHSQVDAFNEQVG